MQNSRFILGVYGAMGSGKTELLKILARNGWFTINADEIVHALYEADQPGQRKIADFFGEDFLLESGAVNRPKLRKVVFKDLKKLRILNALIHPLVTHEVQKILDEHPDERKVAIEAVYFDEKNLGRFVDKILWVERSGGRDGVDVDTSVVVDAVVKNNSTLKALEKKVIIEVEKLIK